MSVTNDIEALLPHRKPFLFVDEIVSADDEGSVSTRKFTDEDFFFKGHFPQYPVVSPIVSKPLYATVAFSWAPVSLPFVTVPFDPEDTVTS